MKSGNKRKLLLISIMIMLVLIAAACAWILYRGVENNKQLCRNVVSAVEKANAKAAQEITAVDDILLDMEAARHIYSHRGSQGPEEHSFKAYDEAIKAGSIYIEQDLVLSSDGVLFVSHDLTAGAMTGVSKSYSSMSADEIDRLRTTRGNKILRMSEVFERYRQSVNYVIELKAYQDSRMVDAFTELVNDYGYQDRIIIQCQDVGTLRALDNEYPDMPKLFICKSEGAFETSLETDCIDIISVKDWLMTEGRCQAAHEHGKIFSAWTLNSESQIRRAIDIGVDTYFTNDTPLALSLEREYGIKKRAGKE